MNNILLEAKNITHKFDYSLFNNFSISLKKKESISISGRSGSGKSTLLNIISTFLKPNSGKVYIFNDDIYDLNIKNIEMLRRKKLGIIFQSHYLFKGMSIIDNIKIGTILAETEIDNEIFKILEIEHLINKKINKLSGGEQQRVSIARVLHKKPKIIYADEATGNLDKKTSDIVMNTLLNYIKEYEAGLIFVSHDSLISKFSDKIYSI